MNRWTTEEEEKQDAAVEGWRGCFKIVALFLTIFLFFLPTILMELGFASEEVRQMYLGIQNSLETLFF